MPCLSADLLVPLAAKMSEEPFRLVIMDSIAANLRVEFTGRGDFPQGCFDRTIVLLPDSWIMAIS